LGHYGIALSVASAAIEDPWQPHFLYLAIVADPNSFQPIRVEAALSAC
jgi:hypothetical protein